MARLKFVPTAPVFRNGPHRVQPAKIKGHYMSKPRTGVRAYTILAGGTGTALPQRRPDVSDVGTALICYLASDSCLPKVNTQVHASLVDRPLSTECQETLKMAAVIISLCGRRVSRASPAVKCSCSLIL